MKLEDWNIVLRKDSPSSKFLVKRCLGLYFEDNPVLPCKSWDTDTLQSFVRIVFDDNGDLKDTPHRPLEVHIPCTDAVLIGLATEETSTFGFTPK